MIAKNRESAKADSLFAVCQKTTQTPLFLL